MTDEIQDWADKEGTEEEEYLEWEARAQRKADKAILNVARVYMAWVALMLVTLMVILGYTVYKAYVGTESAVEVVQ